MKIVLSGQKSFGAAVLGRLTEAHEVALVVSPVGTDRLTAETHKRGLPWCESAQLRPESVPACDLIVAAHSHAFLGRLTRARAAEGAIGYHPSLLPRHRGRDAVRWTVAMGDPIAGGSVYYLTDNVDGGPIVCSDWVHVKPYWDHHGLWREALFQMGVDLLEEAVKAFSNGAPAMRPQDEEVATWEPSWSRPPLYRPELPELGT